MHESIIVRSHRTDIVNLYEFARLVDLFTSESSRGMLAPREARKRPGCKHSGTRRCVELRPRRVWFLLTSRFSLRFLIRGRFGQRLKLIFMRLKPMDGAHGRTHTLPDRRCHLTPDLVLNFARSEDAFNIGPI